MRPEDIKDALLRRLAPWGATARPPAPASTREIVRTFLTERDIRKALTPGAMTLTIGKDAIVSPLALEWLALSGVRIIRSP